MSSNKHSFLRIHPKDNVLVALQDLKAGTPIDFEGEQLTLTTDVAAKHKFSLVDLQPEDQIIMYGVLVGKATQYIPKGGPVSTQTIRHASGEFHLGRRKASTGTNLTPANLRAGLLWVITGPMVRLGRAIIG